MILAKGFGINSLLMVPYPVAMARRKSLYRRYCGFSKSAKHLISAQLVNMLANSLYGFILVLYLDVLGHPATVFGTLGLINEVSMVSVLVASGMLADRFGKKRMLLVGMALSSTGMLILATSFLMLTAQQP